MKNYLNELTDSILKLVAVDSVENTPEAGAPFGKGTVEALEQALSLMKSWGFKVKNLDGYCGWAEIGEGEPFGILGHLDVMPVGKGWTKNPWGEIVDGVIYGRGVMDDKGPMLAAMYAVKALLDEGLTPKKRIRFIFGLNEESGWKCIEHYNEVDVMPETGISPDADFPVINCEKGILHLTVTLPYSGKLNMAAGSRPNVVPNECEVSSDTAEFADFCLKSGLKKISDNRFMVSGVSAHAATPWLGDNAAVKALKLFGACDEELASLSKRLDGIYGEGAGVNLTDEVSGKLTFNVGVLKVENGKAAVTVDMRYPVTFTAEHIVSLLEKTFPEAEISVLNVQQPLYVDKNDPLVVSLLAAYNKVTGQNAEPITIGGGTYARALKHGVAFGPEFPGSVSTIHQPDERASVEELGKALEIYYEAFKTILF